MPAKLTQWFRFGAWRFDISAAQRLISAAPRDPQPVPVAEWASAYGLDRLDNPDPYKINLIGPDPDTFDRDYAMSTDLTRPVLLATFNVDGARTALLIDGVHRLYRAMREGNDIQPGYLLTTDETQQIKHTAYHYGTGSRRTR